MKVANISGRQKTKEQKLKEYNEWLGTPKAKEEIRKSVEDNKSVLEAIRKMTDFSNFDFDAPYMCRA